MLRERRLYLNRKVLSLTLAAALISGLGSMKSPAAVKKITAVKMDVQAETVPGESVFDTSAEVTVKNNNIEVGSCEFVNSGFYWSEEDVPRLEVELYAQDGYYFATTGSSFTIGGGNYVSQKKEDSSQTLIVTIDLPKAGESTRAIETADWQSAAVAGWSSSAGAGSYEVKLYRDGKTVGTVKKTSETRWDFTDSMTKTGNYSFKVRPVNRLKPENVGQWKESPVKYVDGTAAGQNRTNLNGSTAASGSWKQDSAGWGYLNSDGSWPAKSWQSIDGRWYFFNEAGYMAAGWILWNGKYYYCDPQSGRMLAGETTPDGYKVGADGAWIS